MDCSIINDNIRLHLDDTKTAFKMLLESKKSPLRTEFSVRPAGSALQMPDLSRLQLHHILRQSEKEQSHSKAAAHSWLASLDDVREHSSNSNHQENS